MPCAMLFATAIADPRQSEQSLACQRGFLYVAALSVITLTLLSLAAPSLVG
jgi:hypothetical protein